MRKRCATLTCSVVLPVFLLVGCGEKAGPEAPARGPDGAAEEPAAGKPPAFEDEYARVLALEEDARFSQALALLRVTEEAYSGQMEAGTLDAARARLEHERRAALDLPAAVKGLGSESGEIVEAAGRRLAKAGRAGRIFLRKAALEEDGKIAVEAVKLLVELASSGADPGPQQLSSPLTARKALARRLRSRPPEALRSVLAGGLVRLAEAEQSEAGRLGQGGQGGSDPVLKEFYELARDDRKFAYRELVGAICHAFEGRLAKDRAKLARAVGDDGAYQRLKLYVKMALDSGDEALASWASGWAAAVELMVPGLRGSYHHGTEFQKLVHEQLDGKIDVPNRRFQYPDGRQDDISIRWTGFVRVRKAGKYTFYSASDDGQRLWVGGEQLVNDWAMHGVAEKSGEIELKPGNHAFKVEFMQGGGGASITVSWSGPGIEKQVIPEGAFMVVPWKGTK